MREAFMPATLLARLQSRVDAMNVLTAAESAAAEARQHYKQIDQQIRPVVADLQNAVRAAFGPTSPELAYFGFLTRKVHVPTEAEKAAAVARGHATRKARGTLGPRGQARGQGRRGGYCAHEGLARAAARAYLSA